MAVVVTVVVFMILIFRLEERKCKEIMCISKYSRNCNAEEGSDCFYVAFFFFRELFWSVFLKCLYSLLEFTKRHILTQ